MNLKSKNILLTQLRLVDFTGSEIVTLELAEYFSPRANKIFIVTTAFGEPIKKEFEKLKNVQIFNIRDEKLNEIIKEEGIDLAWIHHQMIPDALLENSEKTEFIFHHMSPFAEFEFPFVFSLEEKLASSILVNSEETRKELESHDLFSPSVAVEVFNNPAPSTFNNKLPTRKNIRNLLVVSNHIPQEIEQSASILSKKGVTVDYFGVQKDSYKRLTHSDLQGYDAVVSIGKTVQYAIMSGIPVYCYDIFGGPGYLNASNFEKAKSLNFSGRGFAKKTANVIADELISNFSDARDYAATVWEKEKDTFSLEFRIEKLLKSINKVGKKKNRHRPTEAEISSYKVLKKIIYQQNPSIRRLYNLEQELEQKTGEIKQLEEQLTALKPYRHAYYDVRHSTSYRVGKLVSLPIRAPQKIYRSSRHKLGVYKNLRSLLRRIDEVYQIRRKNTAKKLRIEVVIRSIYHPTSSTFIRLISPFAHRSLQDQVTIRLVDGEQAKIKNNADIVIVQRTAIAHMDDAKKLVETVRAQNMKLFVDTDDAFGELDESHPQYHEQKERVEALDYVIENADEVWFSTEKLRQLYGVKNAHIMKNTLDPRVWPRLRDGDVQVPKKGSPLKALYMGTVTHNEDFEMILPALKKLHDKYPDDFELHVIGVAKKIEDQPWIVRHQPPSALYPDFTKWLSDLGPFDIGLSPLVDNSFNRNKSDIKCLDYLACGIRPVVSNVEAYKNPELDDLIVRVDNSDNSWYETLEAEIRQKDTNRKNAKARAKKGYKYINDKRSNDVIAAKFYRRVAEHFPDLRASNNKAK